MISKTRLSVCLIVGIVLMGASPLRAIEISEYSNEFGGTIGLQGGFIYETFEPNEISIHGREAPIIGLTFKRVEWDTNRYYLSFRLGISPKYYSGDEIKIETSSFLFGGSKNILRIGSKYIPASIFNVNIGNPSASVYGVGSFHYWNYKRDITNYLTLLLELPMSVSPFIGFSVSETSSPALGFVLLPSVQAEFNRFVLSFESFGVIGWSPWENKTPFSGGWYISTRWKL